MNKAIIQHERIWKDYHDSLQEIGKRELMPGQLNLKLFSDIHYYFVCWAEVSKLYSKLKNIQSAFTLVPRQCLQDLKAHRDFRNHLEHIDDRIAKGVSDLGNLSDTEFTFDGKKIDISDNDLEKLKQFYEELLKIS